MPLTRISAGVISDDSITTTKIGTGQVGTTDVATNAITADKLATTLDLSSNTVTLPADSITHTQLQGTYTSGTDDLKFLQISSAGVLQWANPVTVPIPFTSISGTIADTQVPTGGSAIIDSARIVDGTIVDGDIANTTITDGKLATSLDLSSKTLTFPTTQSFTNITVSGTLTVSGATTTIDTNTLNVKDRIITVNQGESGAGVTAGSAGIEVDRGTSPNPSLIWDEATDEFKFMISGGLANLKFLNMGAPAGTIDYAKLDLINNSDPGAGNNYFLESDGNGKLQFTQVNPSAFGVGGILTGTLGNANLAPGSICLLYTSDAADED